MKGPGMRLDLDVRRLWRCDVCQTERHTPGWVTTVDCHFCQDHPAMKLVESQRPDRRPMPPPDWYIDLHPDDVDAPAFVPVHLRQPEDNAVTSPEQPTVADVKDESTAAVAVAESPPPSDEGPQAADESASSPDAPEEEKKPSGRRRKSRRNRKRRRKS